MKSFRVRFQQQRVLVAAIVMLSATRGYGDFPEVVNSQNPKDRPPSPNEAVESIRLPEGFRATLFAGEPDVQQPIAIDTDDRGRVWIAENYTYQGRGFTDQFRDRIVILEDKDNNGAFDKRTVFWDQGNGLSGLTHGFGGVWVLNDGKLQVLMDSNRDDVPDGDPVVMLDGFDNKRVGHNIVNGLLWGPDGWLYGRHGIMATSYVGRPGAARYERTKMNCAIWRFHPTTHVFEVVAHGTTNPWGMDYDDWGEMFFTNNVIGHLWHMVPGSHYRRMYGEDFNPHLYDLMEQCADHYHWDTGKSWTDSRDAKGVHGELGGGHSHCGGMIYLGDNWPSVYRNSIFTCNTHGRRVNRDTLHRHGSGYVGKHAADFMLAGQPWFRGVDLKYGHDGGVYITDWTDIGECHDHDGVHRTSGRIYKVVHGDAGQPVPMDIRDLSDDRLVNLQLHRNDWYVRRARRVLQERAAAGRDMETIQKRLREMYATNTDVTRRLRALWALYVTGGTDTDWLLGQTAENNEHLRVWCIRLLVDSAEVPEDAARRLAEIAKNDDSGLVRMYLASAMQRLPLASRWPIAVALSRHPVDGPHDNLPHMIWYGIEPAVAADPDRAVDFARQTNMPDLRRYVARRLASDLDKQPQPVDRLLRLLAARRDGSFQQPVLDGIVAALRGWRKATPPAAWAKVQPMLLASSNEHIRTRSRELAVVFGDGRAMDALRNIATDVGQSPKQRRDALRVLLQNRPEDLAPILLRLAGDRATAETAIRGLAAYDHPDTPNVVLKQIGRLDHEGREIAIDTLSSRPEFAARLLDAVEQGAIAVKELSAFNARQISALGDESLNRRLEKIWGTVRTTPEEKRKQIESMKERYSATDADSVNLANGRLLFHRVCANCHTLYGQGAKVGPDITGSNRSNLDYLLENVLDPNAVVAREYKMTQFILDGGRVITGMIVRNTDRTVTVQTPKEQLVIDRSEIDESQPSPLSLMPDGLLQNLSESEIRDLIGYLRGKSQVSLPPGALEPGALEPASGD